MMKDDPRSQSGGDCCGGHGMRGRGMHRHGGSITDVASDASRSGKTESSHSNESKATGADTSGGASAKTSRSSVLDILKERLARCEIDIPEFEARKRLILAD